MKNTDRMRIFIKVSPVLREFLVATNRSNTITPGRRDTLWLLVKSHLTTVRDYQPPTKDDEKLGIYINLYNCRGHKIKSMVDGRQLYIDTMWRCSLTAEGERIVVDFMYRRFKETFHTFMAAQEMANPGKSTQKIIRDFIDLYNIDDDIITMHNLYKSWQRDWRFKYLRSPQKKLADLGESHCPAVV